MQSQDNDKTILGGFTLDLVYSLTSDTGANHIIESDVIVGRGKDCDIFIDDKKISRNHAELSIKDGKLKINDLQSSNGTFVNGNKITEMTNLSNGDTISFEKHLYTVTIEMAKNEEPIEEETPVEENNIDFTAVVDMSEDYLEKLRNATKKEDLPPPPLVEAKKEAPVAPTAPVTPPQSSEKESIPSSWIEETGSVDGTRMMGLNELEALRAGVATTNITSNETDVARLHSIIDGQEEIIELNIADFTQASGWEIGRDAACDIVLEHPSVSNRHAQIIHQNGRWKMVNLVSTNGILINGQKKLTTYLSDGDKIGLGTVNLVFKAAKSNIKPTSINNSVVKNKGNFPLVPVLLGMILIVVAVLVYMYLNK